MNVDGPRRHLLPKISFFVTNNVILITSARMPSTINTTSYLIVQEPKVTNFVVHTTESLILRFVVSWCGICYCCGVFCVCVFLRDGRGGETMRCDFVWSVTLGLCSIMARMRCCMNTIPNVFCYYEKTGIFNAGNPSTTLSFRTLL